MKGATSCFAYLEKFSLNFWSSSFVIRVNLLHPWPSLFLYGLLLSLKCFPILVKYHFQLSITELKGHFLRGQNNSKFRDWAPLKWRWRYTHCITFFLVGLINWHRTFFDIAPLTEIAIKTELLACILSKRHNGKWFTNNITRFSSPQFV